MTLEQMKQVEAVVAKQEYTDDDVRTILSDLESWLRPVYAKLPDYSKKLHAYKMKGLRRLIEKFGGETEPAEPPPVRPENEEE